MSDPEVLYTTPRELDPNYPDFLADFLVPVRAFSPTAAVAELHRLQHRNYDPDTAHQMADAVLLGVAPEDVARAYRETRDRLTFWYG